jgi:RimJ/RimL family protein N-acetyltransferase
MPRGTATTERPLTALRLRPERPWREHARLYADLLCDPAVAASLWPDDPPGANRARRAAAALADDIAHWQQHAFGPWVFFEIATGVFVGRGGLRKATFAGHESVELLYAVRPDAWGRGYASEMAGIALGEARRLGLVEVVGVTTTTNSASRRVLEKVGLRPREPLEHAGIPHLLGRLRIVV